MAKVAVAVEKAKPSGLKPTNKGELSVEDEYQFKNDGKTALRVFNGGAEATKVTVVTPGTQGGLAVEDQEIEIPAGEERILGPYETDLYNDAAGLTTVKFTKVTSVTLATFRVS